MDTPQQHDDSTGRVLVIDDDDMVRLAIERGLRRLGYHVTQAAHGQEGLDKLAELQPHVVFLDLRMPGIDGHTFLRRMPATGSDAAVVVMSGQGNMDDVVDVLRAGAVDYLKKPWAPAELMAAVTRGFDAWERRATAAPATAAADEEPAPSAGTPRATFEDVLERVRAGDIRLPSIPSVLTELRTLMGHSETSLSDVVVRIERDPQLASEVLRVSNSAYYARNGRNHDLRTAVSRIGFRQTYTLVETIFASGLWKVTDPVARQLLNAIWQRSLAQAVSMRAVTEMVAVRGELSSDTAYLIGLFAEAGASFLVWVASECGVLAQNGEEAVRAAIRSSHAAIGGLILQRWRFEPAVASAVRAHHASSPGTGTNPYWPIVVVGADMADEVVREDVTTSERRERSLVGARMAELGISDPLRRRLLQDIKQEFEALSRG